jgi:hypothetical protein
MVITDVVAWALAQLDLTTFAFRRMGAFFRVIWACIKRAFPGALLGMVIMMLLWAIQRLVLGPKTGVPIHLLSERHFIAFEPQSVARAFDIFGILAPGMGLPVVDFAFAVLVVASMKVIPRHLRCLPLFPLFGFVMHLFYGNVSTFASENNNTFLFSPNYTPLAIACLALASHRVLPKWTPAITMFVALGLVFYNLHDFDMAFKGLDATHRLRTL